MSTTTRTLHRSLKRPLQQALHVQPSNPPDAPQAPTPPRIGCLVLGRMREDGKVWLGGTGEWSPTEAAP